MTKDEVIFRLAEKVFALEDKLANQLDRMGDLIKGITSVTDDRDAAKEAMESLANEYSKEHKRRIELEDALSQTSNQIAALEEVIKKTVYDYNDLMKRDHDRIKQLESQLKG